MSINTVQYVWKQNKNINIFMKVSTFFTIVSHSFETDGARQMIRNVSYNISTNIDNFVALLAYIQYRHKHFASEAGWLPLK